MIRRVEGLCRVDKFLHFFAGISGPTTAIGIGITRHQRDRPAIETSKPSNNGAAKHAAKLEKRPLVNHRFYDWTHLIDFANIPRDGVDQPFGTPIRRILL